MGTWQYIANGQVGQKEKGMAMFDFAVTVEWWSSQFFLSFLVHSHDQGIGESFCNHPTFSLNFAPLMKPILFSQLLPVTLFFA